MESNILGYVIGILLALVIDYLLAREFYRAAVMKGHDAEKYLWICFFFSVIGYILVTALPDIGSDKGTVQSISNDELPEL